MRRHVEHGGEDATVEVGHLGLAPASQLVPSGVVGGYQPAGFEGVGGVTRYVELLLAGVLSVAEGFLHIADGHGLVSRYVGAVLLVQQHLAFVDSMTSVTTGRGSYSTLTTSMASSAR